MAKTFKNPPEYRPKLEEGFSINDQIHNELINGKLKDMEQGIKLFLGVLHSDDPLSLYK